MHRLGAMVTDCPFCHETVEFAPASDGGAYSHGHVTASGLAAIETSGDAHVILRGYARAKASGHAGVEGNR